MNIKYQPISRFRDYLFHKRIEKAANKKDFPHHPITENLTVSLTTTLSRYQTLHLSITSLLRQSIRPKNLVLWVDLGQKPSLPKKLTDLENHGLSIYETADLGPHTKLLPALKKFPSHQIITVDDDILYPPRFLEKIFVASKIDPEGIHCYRALKMTRHEDGSLKPYNEWPRHKHKEAGTHPNLFPLGYGGVLYPPHCFTDEIFNTKAFQTLCPKADDIWFKTMSALSEKKSYKIPYSFRNIVYLKGSQNIALKHDNCLENDGNDTQIRSLTKHYPL